MEAFPEKHSDNETAGFKCAPDIGEKA